MRNGLAVADQALSSTAGFTVSVVLAHSLSRMEFSRFSVVWSSVLLVAAAHSAFFREPLMVFGSPMVSGARWRYANRVFAVGAGLALPLGAVAVGILLLATPSALLQTPLTLVVVPSLTVALLSLLTIRRVPYLWRSPRVAVLTSAAYLVGIGAAFTFGKRAGLSWAVGEVAAAAGAAATVGYVLTWFHYGRGNIGSGGGDLKVAARHIPYGKWAIGTNLLMWVPVNLTLILIPRLVEPTAVASFKVAITMIMPVTQVQIGLAGLALPLFASQKSLGERRATLSRLAIAYIAVAAVYFMLVLVSGREFVSLLFGVNYVRAVPLISVLAIGPIFTGYNLPAVDLLRSIRRPDLVFKAYAIASAGGLFVSVALIGTLGLTGAAISVLAYYAMQSACVTLMLRSVFRGEGVAQPRNGSHPKESSSNPTSSRVLIWLSGAPSLKPMFRFASVFLGCDVFCRLPRTTILPHPYGIVVHSNARLGERVTIMQQVTIGAHNVGAPLAPTIEDDVFIGAGAKVLGGIRVGQGAVVGANAVVTRDVPDGFTVVGVDRIIERRGGDLGCTK